MKQNIKFAVGIFVLLFASIGCRVLVDDFPVRKVSFPQANTLDIPVQINLSTRIQNAQWETGSGDKIIIPIGETLSYNSEVLARNMFSRVIVNKGEGGISGMTPSVTLTPKIVSLKHTRPLIISGDQQTTLIFQWTIKDGDGNVIWVKTITAGAKSVMGGFDAVARSKEHVELLIDDLFNKSYAAFNLSNEIREFAKSH